MSTMIVASQHTSLEAFQEGFEVWYTCSYDAQVLYYLYCQCWKPEIERSVVATRNDL